MFWNKLRLMFIPHATPYSTISRHDAVLREAIEVRIRLDVLKAFGFDVSKSIQNMDDIMDELKDAD